MLHTTLIFVLINLLTEPADSWTRPKPTNYYNIDSTFYVRVIPQVTPKRYYDWLKSNPQKKKRFLAEDTTLIPCYAMLFKRSDTGDSTMIWRRDLANKIAPVSAFVSKDGQHTLTFDNWHSMGYGTNVMVHYDNEGKLVSQYSLDDMTPFPIDTFTRSVSSIWWRCGINFTDDIRLSICFKDSEGNTKNRSYNLAESRFEK